MKEKKYSSNLCVSFQRGLKALPLRKAWSLFLSDDVTFFSPELLHQQGQEALSVGLHTESLLLMHAAGDNGEFLGSGPSV